MRSHWDQLEESLRRRKCGRDIMGYVTIFKYPKFATLAASGLLEEARAEDPTQYARLASQVSQRDGRTIQEYARDGSLRIASYSGLTHTESLLAARALMRTDRSRGRAI